MPLAIQIRGVVKRYGEITAVDGLDLDVPEGTCVGLLGPHGAGKSTTMKTLTAQAIPDAGEIEVLGLRCLTPRNPPGRGAASFRSSTPRHVAHRPADLFVFAHRYRVPRGERRAAVQRALEIAWGGGMRGWTSCRAACAGAS